MYICMYIYIITYIYIYLLYIYNILSHPVYFCRKSQCGIGKPSSVIKLNGPQRSQLLKKQSVYCVKNNVSILNILNLVEQHKISENNINKYINYIYIHHGVFGIYKAPTYNVQLQCIYIYTFLSKFVRQQYVLATKIGFLYL